MDSFKRCAALLINDGVSLTEIFLIRRVKKKNMCFFFIFETWVFFFQVFGGGGVHVCVKYIIDKQQVAPRQEKVVFVQAF